MLFCECFQDFKEEMQFKRRERGKGAPTKGLLIVTHSGIHFVEYSGGGGGKLGCEPMSNLAGNSN